MKKLNFLTTSFLLTLSTHSAFALQCPDKENIPFCPTSGSTLLDETYPTQAFVMSNLPMLQTKEGRRTTQNFINKVINNYDYKNVPQIILPMSEKFDYDVAIQETRENLEKKKIPADKIAAILAQITYVPTTSYTWQQDWFESFVNLKTGTPEIRQINGYDRVPHDNDNIITEHTKECSIDKGERLVSDMGSMLNKKSFGAGEMGGNIEGLPGGSCMVGDNQGSAFTKQFCGSEDNVVQLQTSWLSVGHVDEIFKIIPTNFNDGRPKECEFSLLAASPRKALELMNDKNYANSSFVDLDSNNPDKNLQEVKTSRSSVNYAGNYQLCRYITRIVGERKKTIFPWGGAKSVFLKLFFNSSMSDAHAETMLAKIAATDPKELANITQTCADNIDDVKNFEMQKIMLLDSNFNDLNNTIQESVDSDKLKIKEQILKKLPQCEKYYDETDVPNIFYGSHPVFDEATQKFVLPRPGAIDSFLPNPTNSVLMNKTIAFPNTGNSAFNNYLEKEMAKKKMKADFIATWDYAHVGQGNIHCSSHSIPHCKPQTTK